MGQSTTRCYIQDGIAKFHQQISGYGMQELRIIYEYYRREMIYIVETMGTEILLRELASRNVLDEEQYVETEKHGKHFEFSEKLVQDVLERGREAVIGFWECLYDLAIDHSCPTLSALVNEIDKTGDTLMQQILLDGHGHSLTPELKDLQGLHKQHLLERAQNLDKNRSPGSIHENERLYIPEHKDLIVVSIRRPHKWSQHWLIESGRKHEEFFQIEQSKLECIPHGRLFRWSTRYKSTPRSVVVSGAPGVGKTTLMQRFVYDWVHGKLYQRFAFVFFFKFQELNRLDEVSLEEMILQECPHLQNHLQDILQDPEKMLFIFDGLDESVHQMDFRLNKLCRDIKQKENLGVIVVSLVKQSLLKGCSILITSRTTKLSSVGTRFFKRVTEIMGLIPRERQMYCEQFFRNKELSEKCFHYMRDNGTLYNFCYIPSFCEMVCTVFSSCFKDHPTIHDQATSPLPKTLTQLFVTFVANILTNHSQVRERARELLTSFGRMAEHGVMNHIVAFNEQDLASFNVDPSSQIFSSFMKKSDHPPNTIFSFIHATLQDFFAALVHYINECPETLQKSLEEAKSHNDSRGEIFLCFLCGLSDSNTRSILKPYLGELSSHTAKEVITFLQNPIADIQDWEDDKRKFLSVFFYLFETQNKDFVLEYFGSFKSLEFSQIHLTPLDCTLLSFILESCRETAELRLDQCNIHSESLERLAPALRTVKSLRFYNNNLRDDGVRSICSALIHPECKIQTLSLTMTGLTDISCSHLGSAISNNQSLRTLDLAYNRLEGPKFSDLMTALSSPTCRIEELHLNSCRLTDSSCSPLASAITNNQSLRVLYLSDNNLAGPHFSDLIAALSSPSCCIEELMIRECFWENEQFPLLVSLSNPTKLRKLDLGSNRFSEADACHIEELILRSPSLKEISIHCYHTVPWEIREKLEKLQDHKPGLSVDIY
ncbi:NACHT, LRR and PYD domains-containing protein 12-like [Pseudophryne corroboree]|uniref:NACHT, LRR and PYD domains-containing protein 12-like n=1 Tax=Pseudophryne corroboree TaxID=495146 RepID=UPI003081B797